MGSPWCPGLRNSGTAIGGKPLRLRSQKTVRGVGAVSSGAAPLLQRTLTAWPFHIRPVHRHNEKQDLSHRRQLSRCSSTPDIAKGRSCIDSFSARAARRPKVSFAASAYTASGTATIHDRQLLSAATWKGLPCLSPPAGRSRPPASPPAHSLCSPPGTGRWRVFAEGSTPADSKVREGDVQYFLNGYDDWRGRFWTPPMPGAGRWPVRGIHQRPWRWPRHPAHRQVESLQDRGLTRRRRTANRRQVSARWRGSRPRGPV
ncbi:hypothetical protein SAMN05216276_10524 [Streptosporangium subroseum]|uniref:Uncharacterized protein n=1 Tax=Streptosporangium subroseum TaxID=106412 RepID=A0A239N5S0_9ACTN|nr:hypothetical protein SAMN05216276_10524 [Streptosporangium subroseum]